MFTSLFLAAWIITSVMTYGYSYGHFQRKYPTLAKDDENSDRVFAVMYAIFPFVGLIVVLIVGGDKYGMKF